jgi:PKD repeat protein
VSAVATNASCATCTDGSATATIIGGSPPYAYTWYTSPVQTTQTATGLPQGTYVVCAGDAYGCTACDTVTVGIGSCSAYFSLYPDTIPHYYYAVNQASGIPPLSFDWNWGDGSPHDTVPYPNHTYANAGFYTICLVITDSVGCTNSVCTSYYLTRMESSIIYVNVVASLPTGIAGHYDDNFFSVFPNPSFDFININLYDRITETVQVKIYDVLGKIAWSLTTMEPKISIDISKLSKGTYFVEVISANQTGRQKFIKQ